jgi:hypothetical protein
LQKFRKIYYFPKSLKTYYISLSEFLLHPYPRTVPADQIVDILKRPYVNMFGELDLDTLEQGVSGLWRF